jgi:hypothetical protein
MTFTQEDQAMLDDLTFRKAMADWSAREDDRKRNLAALSEVAKVFTSETIGPIVSGMRIVNLIERLSAPEPEPAVTTVAAPAAT